MKETCLESSNEYDCLAPSVAGPRSASSSLARWLVTVTASVGLLLPGLASAQLTLSKTRVDTGCGATSCYIGDTQTFQLIVGNNFDTGDITDLAFNDDMPDGWQVVGGAGAITTNCTDGNGAPTAFGGNILLSSLGADKQRIVVGNGVVPPRNGGVNQGQCVITVPVTSYVAGNLVNTVAQSAVSGMHEAMPVTGSGVVPASQSLSFQALAAPTLSKNFSPNTIVKADQHSRLTVTISNPSAQALALNGTGDAPAWAIQDRLGDYGLKVSGSGGTTAPDPAISCTGSGVAPTWVNVPAPDDTLIQARGGVVAAGGSCTLAVNVLATGSDVSYSQSQTNVINGSTDFHNRRQQSAVNASRQLTVNGPLRVSKMFAPQTIAQGMDATLTIVLNNESPLSTLTLGAFSDDIDNGHAGPGGLTIQSVAQSCGAGSALSGLVHNGQAVSYGSGVLAPGTSCTITVTYRGAQDVLGIQQSFINRILESGVAVTSPAGVVSNFVEHSVNVVNQLLVEKERSPAVVAPGNPVRFSVTVNNFSNAGRTITVSDQLQGGMMLLTSGNSSKPDPSVSGAGCVAPGGVTLGGTSSDPTFTFGMLANTGATATTCVLVFWAKVPEGGAPASISNQIPAGGVCDGLICNHAASSNVSFDVAGSALVLEKGFDAPTKPEGTPATVTISLVNLSANPLTSAQVVDSLPVANVDPTAQLLVADPPNMSSTCVGATLSVASDRRMFSVSNATVPARENGGLGSYGRCTVTFNVTAPAGTYVNELAAGVGSATQTLPDGSPDSVSNVASTSASVVFQSALSGSKIFTPASIQEGGRSTVRMSLQNAQAGVLSGVRAHDVLPAGMVVADPPNAYSTCNGPIVIDVVAGSSQATLSGGVIPAYGSCDFLFDVTATGGAAWTNTIPIGGLEADGAVRNQAPFGATLGRLSGGGLAVAIAHASGSIAAPGAVTQLTITIQNNSAFELTNLGLTNWFTNDGLATGSLTGERIANVANATTTCTGGLVGAGSGATSWSLSGASLAVGATCMMTVDVTMLNAGNVAAILPAGAISSDQGVSNGDQVQTSLQTGASIGIVKQFSPRVIEPGGRSRLRITLYNPTSQPVSNVALSDTLPAGLIVATPANLANTCGAVVDLSDVGVVALSAGQLTGGSSGSPASCYVELDVTASAAGDYQNVINAGELTALQGGSPVSNGQPTSDTLRVKSPLVIQKAIAGQTLDASSTFGFSTNSVANGDAGVAYTLAIRLHNPNATALTALSFSDALPAGLVVAPIPGVAMSGCGSGVVSAEPSGTVVSLTQGGIAGGGTCQINVSVLSNIPGTYSNTIGAGAVSSLEGVSNEEPTRARIVIASPPKVSKQFEPAVIPPAGTSLLTIFIDNPNDGPMTLSAALTDILPTQASPITALPGTQSHNCTSGSVTLGTVSGTANRSVVLGSGTVVQAGGCQVTVMVSGTDPGSYHNNIPTGALQTNYGANLGPADASLTISTLGYISGKVYRDNVLNDGGAFQAGTDGPIAGAVVELRVGSSCGGALLASAVSDGAGNYLFSGLPEGSYSVCQPSQPGGTLNALPVAGTGVAVGASGNGMGGTPANPVSGTPTSQITGIVLTSDGHPTDPKVSGSIGNNFPEVMPSSIAGKVFMDINNDGLQQGGDPGLAGVEVRLAGVDWLGLSYSATVHTTSDGSYVFAGVPPGTYVLTEPVQPAGTANGKTTAGTIGGITVGNPAVATIQAPDVIDGIVLSPNVASIDNNFGEIPAGRSVFGRVFLDWNDDGVANGADYGLGGQVFTLVGFDINNNPVNLTTISAADGSFVFTNVPEGNNYALTQPNQPPGTVNGLTTEGSAGGVGSARNVLPSRVSGIDLSGGTTVSANNLFAEIPAPVIAAPDLTVSKTHTPARFVAGATGSYTLLVRNVGTVSSSGEIVVTDTLPTGLQVTEVPFGQGWTCTSAVQVVTCRSTETIEAGAQGQAIVIPVAVASTLSGQMVVNNASVSGGGEPPEAVGNNSTTDPTPVDGGRITLEGHVWRDFNHDRRLDQDEPRLPGWIVELLLNGRVIDTKTTDENGHYIFIDLIPGGGYEVRFRDPDTGAIYGRAVPNERGLPYERGVVDGTTNPAGADNGGGTLGGMILPGHNVVEQSLPLDPAGVVYDAVTRLPVEGAVVEISGPNGFSSEQVVGGVLAQTTGPDGRYQFMLLPGAPAGIYTISVTSPSGYLPGPSSLIPACVAPLQVGPWPDPALVQSSSQAPAGSTPVHDPGSCPGSSAQLTVGSGSTQYWFSFNLDGGSADLINNHIPLDPFTGAIVVTKSTPLVNVGKGGLVPYTITATNTLGASVTAVDVRDLMPPGFQYRSGSGSVRHGGSQAFQPAEPLLAGRELRWGTYTFLPGEEKVFRVVLVVGAGVSEGEYTNLAWAARHLGNQAISNVASAVVRIIPEPVFDCADLIGKVFDDRNANGYQDDGEQGIPNVRVVSARGLLITSDVEGRFHVPCAAVPNADRGSNFVMKLDERTLPSGYRVTTENPRDVRLTRGKMSKLNFGATVHRVFRVELDMRAFDGQDELLPEWTARLHALAPRLAERPAVARLAYRLTAGEDAATAARRLEKAKAQLIGIHRDSASGGDHTQEKEDRPPLVIEMETMTVAAGAQGERK